MWRSRRRRRGAPRWLGPSLAGLLLLATPASGAPPAPDPRVQAQMQRVVEAVVDSRGDAVAAVDRLSELGLSRGDLLAQVALFLAGADGTEEAMSGALALQRLAFNDDEKIAAIVPLLETEDRRLRHVLHDLLGTVDRPEGGDPDFTPYLPLLTGSAPSPGLVRYLYETDAGAALRAMRAANPGAALASDERDVKAVEGALQRRSRGAPPDPAATRSAASAVERLSRSPVWWVRLFAAAAVRQDPSLAVAGVRERLADDDHPVVRDLSRG